MTNEIELKKHNLETYKAIKEAYKKRNHIGTVQATGTGKSFIIAKTIQDMEFKKPLFLTPSLHIIEEFKNNFPSLIDSVTFMTYKKLTYIKDIEHFLNENNFDFVVLDEYHRCGAKTWGKAVKTILSKYKDKKVLGATATPIRYLDSCRDMTKELFNSEPVIEISLLKAIKAGILPRPKYILSYYDVKEDIDSIIENVETSSNTDIAENIQYIVNNMDKLVNVEEVLIKNITTERKFIIFCANVNHAKEMSKRVPKWFKNIGFETKEYSIYTDIENMANTENMKLELEKFRKSIPAGNEMHLLFSVNILNEGVHIKDVDGLIFLRKTSSPIILYQQLGRALKAGDKNSPLVFDFVNNIGKLSFLGERIDSKAGISIPIESNIDYSIDGLIEVIDYTADLNNLLAEIEAQSAYSSWESFIEAIVEYKNEYGHCNIPSNHKLYKRCLKIRKNYESGRLDENKFKDLDKLGFKWSISVYNDEHWEEMFNELVLFAKEYKHANVPRSYKNKKLATWVQTQRKYKDTMSTERKERLLSVGFEFEIGKKRNEKNWEEMFNQLLEFKEEFKHVNVSSRYKNKKLANWVNSQRKSYKAGKLSTDRYERLIKIGFVFPEKSL